MPHGPLRAARRWPLVFLALIALTGWPPTFAQRTFVISPPGINIDKVKISEDGTLVVLHERDLFSGFYSLRPDGSGFAFTGAQYLDERFNISGEGRHLIRDRVLTNGNVDIVLLDLETMQETVILGDPHTFYLSAISDDGSLISWTDTTMIYAADGDGSNQRTLGGMYAGYPGGPSITSDGSVIVFEDSVPSSGDSGVWRINRDGSNLTLLAQDPNMFFMRVRIAGDGSVVTFEDYVRGLWAVDPDGTNLRPLITGLLGDYWGEGVDFNDVNTDGSLAVWSSTRWTIVARTDGSGLLQLPGEGGPVDISGRGDVVVYAERQDGVYVLVSQGVPGVSPGAMIDLAVAADGQTLSWATRPSANAHNLYRASTASPGAVDSSALGGCLQGGILGTTAGDADIPAPGEAFLYYVTGENGWGEGPAGFNDQGTERFPAVSCPDVDSDGDTVIDALDVCPLLSDPAQDDPDGDGIGTACDVCPGFADPGQLRAWADADVGGLIGYIPDTMVTYPNGGEQLDIGTVATLQWSTTRVCDLNAPVDILLSRNGPGGPFELLVSGAPNTGSWDWTVTGPAVNNAAAILRVVVTDVGPSVGQDESDAGFRIR